MNEIIEVNDKELFDAKKMISAKGNFTEQYKDKYSSRIITIIFLWYFWSGCTLYLNKYLVDFQNADPTMLSKLSYIHTDSIFCLSNLT